jgi:hypothetical protein
MNTNNDDDDEEDPEETPLVDDGRKKDPTTTTARGMFYKQGLAADDNIEKVALFSKAIELQPDYPEAFNSQGNANRRLGHHDEQGHWASTNNLCSRLLQ